MAKRNFNRDEIRNLIQTNPSRVMTTFGIGATPQTKNLALNQRVYTAGFGLKAAGNPLNVRQKQGSKKGERFTEEEFVDRIFNHAHNWGTDTIRNSFEAPAGAGGAAPVPAPVPVAVPAPVAVPTVPAPPAPVAVPAPVAPVATVSAAVPAPVAPIVRTSSATGLPSGIGGGVVGAGFITPRGLPQMPSQLTKEEKIKSEYKYYNEIINFINSPEARGGKQHRIRKVMKSLGRVGDKIFNTNLDDASIQKLKKLAIGKEFGLGKELAEGRSKENFAIEGDNTVSRQRVDEYIDKVGARLAREDPSKVEEASNRFYKSSVITRERGYTARAEQFGKERAEEMLLDEAQKSTPEEKGIRTAVRGNQTMKPLEGISFDLDDPRQALSERQSMAEIRGIAPAFGTTAGNIKLKEEGRFDNLERMRVDKVAQKKSQWSADGTTLKSANFSVVDAPNADPVIREIEQQKSLVDSLIAFGSMEEREPISEQEAQEFTFEEAEKATSQEVRTRKRGFGIKEKATEGKLVSQFPTFNVDSVASRAYKLRFYDQYLQSQMYQKMFEKSEDLDTMVGGYGVGGIPLPIPAGGAAFQDFGVFTREDLTVANKGNAYQIDVMAEIADGKNPIYIITDSKSNQTYSIRDTPVAGARAIPFTGKPKAKQGGFDLVLASANKFYIGSTPAYYFHSKPISAGSFPVGSGLPSRHTPPTAHGDVGKIGGGFHNQPVKPASSTLVANPMLLAEPMDIVNRSAVRMSDEIAHYEKDATAGGGYNIYDLTYEEHTPIRSKKTAGTKIYKTDVKDIKGNIIHKAGDAIYNKIGRTREDATGELTFKEGGEYDLNTTVGVVRSNIREGTGIIARMDRDFLTENLRRQQRNAMLSIQTGYRKFTTRN